ncbi:hypothetical protein [Terrisporobacter muris]|uniref:Uncharacterized protein n=1 Tax=Terrisporobacter muris TaxID=2963284 RepID=A0A9X2M954_9FIRM|nr:hypothetical protein [Terrisporobacter muris]MCR1821888.1 hypothetical protein [Terrisporobacter muris]
MNNEIIELYLNGYIELEIVNMLNKKYDYVKKCIENTLDYELKKIHKMSRNKNKKIIKLNRDRIKSLYLKGYNSKEISNILELKEDRVRQYITRNFLEYKEIHRHNRLKEKDIKRAIDNQVNSFISNKNFLKQNRQAYKYNKNMNITFDEKNNGVRTDDVPKTFYRENTEEWNTYI